MSFILRYDERADKDVMKLNQHLALRVVKILNKKLGEAPLQYGHYLGGPLHPHQKLRIGDVRVVYRVDEATQEVFILCIGKRKDDAVYKEAMKRIS